jgi:hypothetical protein
MCAKNVKKKTHLSDRREALSNHTTKDKKSFFSNTEMKTEIEMHALLQTSLLS